VELRLMGDVHRMNRPAVWRRRPDDVAHRGGLTFGRIEMATPSGEPRKFSLYGLQFGDALLGIDRPPIDELNCNRCRMVSR